MQRALITIRKLALSRTHTYAPQLGAPLYVVIKRSITDAPKHESRLTTQNHFFYNREKIKTRAKLAIKNRSSDLFKVKFSPLSNMTETKHIPSFQDNVSTVKLIFQNRTLSRIIPTPIPLLGALADIYMQNPFPLALGLAIGGICYLFHKSQSENIVSIEVGFVQENFDSLIRKLLPHLKFNPNGMCFGHVNLWYQLHLHGRNYIEELNNIKNSLQDKKSLSSSQLHLLNSLSKIQKLQETRVVIKKFGVPLHFLRRKIVSQAIEQAIQNPNKLIALIPIEKSNDSHFIGVIADDKGVIKYFDPNVGVATFNDANLAKIHLSRLLVYTYTNIYSNLSAAYRETPPLPELQELSASRSLTKK